MSQVTVLYVRLEIEGERADAYHALRYALDNGALQDAINEWHEEGDEDDERGQVRVLSALQWMPGVDQP